MKVLKEGKAHRRTKYICECNFCESKIQIWDGDPLAYPHWIGHIGAWELKFKCPVCGSISVVRTDNNGLVVEKDALLSKEDKEEISNFVKNFSTKNLTRAEMNQLHINEYTSDDPRFTEYV